MQIQLSKKKVRYWIFHDNSSAGHKLGEIGENNPEYLVQEMWPRHLTLGMVLAAYFLLTAARSLEKRALIPGAKTIGGDEEHTIEKLRSPRDLSAVAIPTNSTEGCTGSCNVVTASDTGSIRGAESPTNNTMRPSSSDTSAEKHDGDHTGNLGFDTLRPAKRLRRSPFVIGGQDANPGEIPWQALVSFEDFFCGGVLVHGCYVLTAKRCALAPVDNYTVTLGDYNRSSIDGTEQVRQVLKIFLHPTYDAALLLLKTGTNTSGSYVRPVPDLASSLPPVGSNATVSGWGAYQRFFYFPDVLQVLSLPVVNSTKCAEQVDPILDIFDRPALQEHEVCAGATHVNYANTCYGDEGSPLVWFDGTSYQLIGIASRGVPYCPSIYDYAIYVSVPAIREWILSILPARNADPDASCACLHPATRHLPNGATTLQYGTWDGANCYLGPARQGCGQQPPENKAFISANQYYLTPLRAIECPQGVTGRTYTWDSCNCHLMNIPAGVSDFIYQNGYYVTGVGQTCPVIGTWDGANCLVEVAPLGTVAFKYAGNWYSSARASCNSPFSFDGANCLFQTIPPGGFIWGNCYFRPTTSPGVCPAGSSFDGANCLIRCPPVATTAFAYSGKWFHTPQKQCDSGYFDNSQNCLYMTPPPNTFAFEFSQNWYYGW